MAEMRTSGTTRLLAIILLVLAMGNIGFWLWKASQGEPLNAVMFAVSAVVAAVATILLVRANRR